MKEKNTEEQTDEQTDLQTVPFRAGLVGLIGHPNAGKSSLLNRLIEEKVAIVTAKPQTTRRRVLGLVNEDHAQFVFVDAPGLVKSSSGINKFLMQEMQEVVQSSDALLVVVSTDEKRPEDIDMMLEVAQKSKKPWAVFVNKTDLVEKMHRLSIIKGKVDLLGGICFHGTCSHDEGIPKKEILNFFRDKLRPSPAPLYDTEFFTPHTLRELVTEIVREKCFEELHQEIPYSLAVRILKYDESGKMPRIAFEILVNKLAHKAMVIGEKGKVMKEIGMAARKDIEKLLGQQVFIEFHVAAKENWITNKRILKELGYDLDESVLDKSKES